MKLILLVCGVALLLTDAPGCRITSHGTQLPAFPQLNLKADTTVIYSKWHSLKKYDREQTAILQRYFSTPEQIYDDSSNCFGQVTYHFQLYNKNYYIVDWTDSLLSWGAATSMYVFVPDSNKYQFLQELALSYGSEGSQLETASWLFDSDGDLTPELFTRSYSYYITGDTTICYDSITAWRFEKNGLKSIPVADPDNLKKKLRLENAMMCEAE